RAAEAQRTLGAGRAGRAGGAAQAARAARAAHDGRLLRRVLRGVLRGGLRLVRGTAARTTGGGDRERQRKHGEEGEIFHAPVVGRTCAVLSVLRARRNTR